MKRPLVLFTISILSVLCLSHELFLKTDAYFLAPGQASELYLFNGTFDKSENSITTDRITDVTILGPNYSFGMDYEKLYEKENVVPLSNPCGINVGESISFKLLRDGKPLGNHVVHYSTSMPGKDAHENETSTQTDSNGVVTMTPTQSGNWYVATIHMQKSDEDGIDYESNWATLTFGVK